MKNYAVQSDGNVDRNKRIIKAFEALGVENDKDFIGVAVAGNLYYNDYNALLCSGFSSISTIITLEKLEELAYNVPKEGDEVWVWNDDDDVKIKYSYLGFFKGWHMVQGDLHPLAYKHAQKIKPNKERIKELEAKIKEIQKKFEELK
jgi:hypothetical protein